MTFDEMVQSWSEESTAGNPETRNVIANELSKTEKLTELIERTVQFLYPSLTPTVERLLGLMKDKDTLHDELKQVILGMPFPGTQRALVSMSFTHMNLPNGRLDDNVHQRPHRTSPPNSRMSPAHPPSKRSREDDEMDTGSSTKDETMRDLSVPVSAAEEHPKTTTTTTATATATTVAKEEVKTPVLMAPPNGTSTRAENEDNDEMADVSAFIQTPAEAILSPRDVVSAEIGMDFKLSEIDLDTFVESSS